jgi:hypothetical protein
MIHGGLFQSRNAVSISSAYNETLSVSAMRVCNSDRSPLESIAEILTTFAHVQRCFRKSFARKLCCPAGWSVERSPRGKEFLLILHSKLAIRVA